MKARLIGLGVGAATLLVVAIATTLAPNHPSTGNVASTTLPGSSLDQATLLKTLAAQGYNVTVDSGHHHLPDVLANFLYGSDPHAFSTFGNGVPDGWFAKYGFNPATPGLAPREAAAPPPKELPVVYRGTWPQQFRWTLAEVYAAGRPADFNLTTYWENGIDPREWKGPGGIPLGWLHHYGLPLNHDVSTMQSSGGETVLQAYQLNLDPTNADADNDCLPDYLEATRYHTDPHKSSTIDSGVPDGWLVHYGLDPLNRTLASTDIAGKGMTVAQTWAFDSTRFGYKAAVCGGVGLDPTHTSERPDGIPDGWLVKHGLDPLKLDVATQRIGCASDFAQVRNLTQAPPGFLPIPDLCLTVGDAYHYGRPDTWKESLYGPWLGGLDPTKTDQTGSGLPDAVKLRGWYIKRTLDVGPGAPGRWILVKANPLRIDTSGSGITDAEKYFGAAVRDGQTYFFTPSDPGNQDTAFSGLRDNEKVFATLDGVQMKGLLVPVPGGFRSVLDPTRADSAGSALRDKEYLDYWQAEHQAAQNGDPYTTHYPSSLHHTYLDWINAALKARGQPAINQQTAIDMLAPDGHLFGQALPNLVNPTPDGSEILAGWKLHPDLLKTVSGIPEVRQRSPIDPANPDTSGGGLPDAWKLRYGQPQPPCLDPGLSISECVHLGNPDRSDLDPALSDSTGLGPDAKQNLDQDVIHWTSFKKTATGLKPQGHDYDFNNAEKFLAGADPHDPHLERGASDGWVYFWGKVYPDLAAKNPDAVGDYPKPDDLARQIIQQQAIYGPALSLVPPMHDLTQVVKQTVPYYRFAVEGGPDAQIRSGETLRQKSPTIHLDAGGQGIIDTITGNAAETLAQDAATGANPYVMDTNGNGISDAWEIYYGAECNTLGITAGAPNPVIDTSKADPLGKHLTNQQEYLNHLDPCLTSTRHDTYSDLVAHQAGADLLPRDIGAASQTDPERDTAFSGLLDSPSNICFDATKVPPRLVGIAHHAATGSEPECANVGGSAQVIYLGSQDRDPSIQDTSGDGVPDGWKAYYNLPLGDVVDQATIDNYACNRPTWWSEPTLGPWWWGQPPGTQGQCVRDLNYDGLDDLNGEDPGPAAQHTDPQGTPVGTFPAVLSQNLDSVKLEQLAQHYGDCAGDPTPCRSVWQTSQPLLSPSILSQVQVSGLPDGKLPKGTTFLVTGRLQATCSGAPCGTGLDGRTVVLRIGSDMNYDVRDTSKAGLGSILGVGITHPDPASNLHGVFSLQACLCGTPGSFNVAPGQVVLGQSSGTAAWQSRANQFADGALVPLMLHAYAHLGPDANGAAKWVGTPLAVTSASSTLTLNLPHRADWKEIGGRSVPISAILTDSVGGPVMGKTIHLSYSASDSNLPPTLPLTDASGQTSATLNVPDGLVGHLDVTATFMGDGNTPPSSNAATLYLPAPINIDLQAPSKMHLGVPDVAHITLTDPNGKAAAGVDVQGFLGPLPLGSTTTDKDGHAVLALRADSLAPGSYPITVLVVASDAHQGKSASSPVEVATGSILAINLPTQVQSGGQLHITGTLTQGDASPIPDAGLDVLLDGRFVGQVQSDGEGRIDDLLTLPNAAPAGMHSFSVRYAGTSGIEGTQQQAPVAIQVTSLLQVNNVVAAPGQTAWVHGQLIDLTGRAIGHQALTIHMSNRVMNVVDLGNGRFSAPFPLGLDFPLGDHLIDVDFAGSANGTYGAAMAQAHLTAATPTRIVFEPALLQRGNNTLAGHLLQGFSDRSIPGATLQIRVPGFPPAFVVTDQDGFFNIPVSISATLPGGLIPIHASFEGTSTAGPIEADEKVPFAPATHLAVLSPLQAGRGTPFSPELALLDDAGNGVQGNMNATFLGMATAVATNADGIGNPTWNVPASTGAQGNLSFSYAGDAFHAPTHSTLIIPVKAGARLILHTPKTAVSPSQALTLDVLLVNADGQPITGQPIVLRVAGQMSAILLHTDAHGTAQGFLSAPPGGDFAVEAAFPGSPSLAATQANLQLAVRVSSTDLAPVWSLAAAGLAAAAVVAIAALAIRRSRLVTFRLQRLAGGIRADSPWSAGILLAYRLLVEHLDRLGVPDMENQSMREFARQLVAVTSIPEATVVRFVRIVEAAQYSKGRVDPSEALAANSLLNDMVRGLQGAR